MTLFSIKILILTVIKLVSYSFIHIHYAIEDFHLCMWFLLLILVNAAGLMVQQASYEYSQKLVFFFFFFLLGGIYNKEEDTFTQPFYMAVLSI